jgi:TonB-dependent Receptor Plug Domain/CarboxypepD_reg-like domain
MKKIPLLALLALICGSLWAQKFTVSGFVTDGQSGEKLISARVFDPDRKLGAMTNSYGFYSITAERGMVALNCSYVGFKPFNTAFTLTKDTTINIDLVAEGVELEGIEITDQVDVADNAQMSQIDVPIEIIKKIPSLMGEVDVIKALQLLPGVQSGGEGSTGFYVRGGGPDQNLILLDGVPVYNVSHLFGFFSVFPADAISNVSLIKGGFPARYGGRLSSVIDISLKDGNMKKFHGEGSVGLISSKLTLEGPIWKDKTSFMVSGRRTYLDLLAQPFILAASKGNTSAGYYFYDMVGKVNHKFNDQNRMYLSFYGGNDQAYLRDKASSSYQGVDYSSVTKFKLGWGNKIAAIRWNHLFSDKLFANFTGTYSTFSFRVGADQSDASTENGQTSKSRFALGYDSGIRDFNLRTDFDWYASPNHLIRFGGYGIDHKFTPGVSDLVIQTDGYSLDTVLGASEIAALEAGLYIEDDFKIGNRQKMNLGLHGSGFWVDQKFYRSLQPRISYRLLVDENWAVKASFTTMYQYIHLLTNANIGLPTDLWVPSTGKIKPQTAYQGAVGIARSFKDQGLEFTVEAYYKYMTGLIEYKEGATFFGESSDWQSKVEQGHGWAYGGEFFLQKKFGKTTGWIGYTLSWNKRQFDNLNNGNVFPYKYDRRHDASFVLTHEFNKKVDVGLVWVYGTGNATTLPQASFQRADLSSFQQFGGGGTLDYIGERNGYRMHAYHRLDLSVNLNKQLKHWMRTWTFGVYNAYSRRNPYFLYFDTDYATDKRVLKQVSIFPIIPSVSYRFKF